MHLAFDRDVPRARRAQGVGGDKVIHDLGAGPAGRVDPDPGRIARCRPGTTIHSGDAKSAVAPGIIEVPRVVTE